MSALPTYTSTATTKAKIRNSTIFRSIVLTFSRQKRFDDANEGFTSIKDYCNLLSSVRQAFNFRDQLRCGMSRQIGYQPYAPAIGLYHFCFWQPVGVELLAICAGVVAAFDVDGGL